MSEVGKTVPHESATSHVTGTAQYIDDLPRRERELCVGFVGAPVAAGVVVTMDTSAAALVDGVRCVLTYKDIGGPNCFGAILSDEPFLVEDEISYLGQPVVVIGAESREAVAAACAAVRLTCTDRPPLLTIDQAIAADSYIGPRRRIVSSGAEDDGQFDAAFSQASHRFSGRFHSGGQEQFYFETQAALAEFGASGELRVISSTQNPTETQAVVAEALGLGMHQVVCECHRMGGGFGGKETQSALTAVMAAMVTQATGRPARLALSRSQDMAVTGKRHQYQTDYREIPQDP